MQCGQVLVASEPYEQGEVGTERRALVRHRDAQGKAVLKEFQRLA